MQPSRVRSAFTTGIEALRRSALGLVVLTVLAGCAEPPSTMVRNPPAISTEDGAEPTELPPLIKTVLREARRCTPDGLQRWGHLDFAAVVVDGESIQALRGDLQKWTLRMSSDGGRRWTEKTFPYALFLGPEYRHTEPPVGTIVRGDDRYHAIWLARGSSRRAPLCIFYSQSRDGEHWEPKKQLLTGSNYSPTYVKPRLWVRRGSVEVFYTARNQRTFTDDLFLRRSADGGQNWLPQVLVGQGVGGVFDVAHEGNSVAAVWITGGVLCTRASSSLDTGWGGTKQLPLPAMPGRRVYARVVGRLSSGVLHAVVSMSSFLGAEGPRIPEDPERGIILTGVYYLRDEQTHRPVRTVKYEEVPGSYGGPITRVVPRSPASFLVGTMYRVGGRLVLATLRPGIPISYWQSADNGKTWSREGILEWDRE